MRILLLYGTLLALLYSPSSYADPPETMSPETSTTTLFVPIVKAELAFQHPFSYFDNWNIAGFGMILPTLNFIEGTSPVVVVGLTIETPYLDITPLGGFVFNHLDPFAGLVGFRFALHSAKEIPRPSAKPTAEHAHHVGATPHSLRHTHLGLTITALFDPYHRWTETEIDATIAPHWLVEFGVKGQIEGRMDQEMFYLAGPSVELKPINKPTWGTLTFGLAYLGGMCGEERCHGPFARLAYTYGL